MKTTFKPTILAMMLAGAAVATTFPALAQDAGQTAQAPDGATPDTAPPDGGHPQGWGPQGHGMMPFMAHDLEARLKSFDTNGDGKVTAEEIQAGRKAEAAALDANGDGKISAEELANAEMTRLRPIVEARAKARVEALDTDGDGLLSAAELALPPMPQRLLNRLGADGDGIDLATLDEKLGQMERRGMPGGPGMKGPGMKGPGMKGDGVKGEGHGPQGHPGVRHGVTDGVTPPARPAPDQAN